ncbi:MAG: alpha/beta hydrolase [Leptolyngbya sp. DLM2.Bin15]|nr:MAG: alpha/beta hydrolase [Leptolyngbya sp. DLM2.Bin15]
MGRKQTGRNRWLCGIGMVSSCLVLGWGMPAAIAAERIVFRYAGFERSLSVQELTTFAETGELSSNLAHYANRTDKDPDDLRRALVRPIPMRLVFLDAALNSWVGEMLLDRVGQTIHTSSGEANQQALRAALILSASDDDAITLLEVIQNYPTEEVYVDGENLLTTYYQVSRWSDRAQELFEMVERLNPAREE